MGGRNSRKRFLTGRRIRKHVQLSLLEEEPLYSGVSVSSRLGAYSLSSTRIAAAGGDSKNFSAEVYASEQMGNAFYPVVRNNGLDVYLKYGW